MDTTQTITHLSLCSGYGGIDLGLRSVLSGLRTCAYVEIEAFSCANLVSKMQEGWLDAAPIWSDLKSFNAKPFLNKVDILSGGFPCQPFSHAGQRKGTDDPRHLFPEIERIIRECEPRMLFLENVEGIISSKYGGTEQSVLHYVLGRLESMGFRAEAGLFSAEECLYPHRRKRIFIAGLRNTYYSSKPTLSKHDETSGLPKHRELADTDRDTCRQGESRRASGELREESRGLRGGEDKGQARQESRCRCSDERNKLANTNSCRGEEPRLLDAGIPTKPSEDLADTISERHGGITESIGREGEASEPNHGDDIRTEVDGLCELVNPKSGGVRRVGRNCEEKNGETEAGRKDNRGNTDSEKRCPELGDTQHNGPLTTGNIGKLQGEPNGSEESEQQSEGSGIRELADTDSSRGGQDRLSTELRSKMPIEPPRDGRGCQAREDDQEWEGGELDDTKGGGLEGGRKQECRPAMPNRGEQAVPSRPGQPQHYWEAPRTIGDEEIVTAMGGSDYGSADGNILRNQRIDSLRALGNGVVPATAARAFVILMDRLGGQP